MLKTPLVKLEAIYNHERFENKIRIKNSGDIIVEKGLKKELVKISFFSPNNKFHAT